MLKAISSITNAIGALNFKGTWNASTNTPTIVSGDGVKGDYFVVGVAGSTTIDGISNWGVGDWIAYNGSVWQRVEGGADLNGVNLSVSGTSTLSNLTASTALALNASKEIVSVTNTGTGNNVLATAPTLVGDVAMSTGNVVFGTSGKGITDSTGAVSLSLSSTALTANAPVFSTLFKTENDTVSAPNSVATIIFTTPTLNNGTFIISCNVPANDPANFSAVSLVTVDATTLRATSLQTAALLSISVSGQTISATQLSGLTVNIFYTVTRVS